MPSSLRVLIVEADSAARELIQLTLNTAALTFTVTVTETLAGFEQLLSAQSWDVVLSDYRLPGFTAYQVLALLQQSGQQIPLILVTDSLGEAAAIDCIKAGMTDYVLNDRLFRLPIVLERSHREFELRRQQQVATAQMRQQSQRQTIINRIVQAMRETLVLDEVLQKTVDMVREVLVSTCCLIVRPARNSELIVRNVSEASPGWQRLLDHACEAFPHYEQALRQGEIVLVHTATPIAQTAVLEMMARYRVHAFLIVPLLYQREFFGWAFIVSERNTIASGQTTRLQWCRRSPINARSPSTRHSYFSRCSNRRNANNCSTRSPVSSTPALTQTIFCRKLHA